MSFNVLYNCKVETEFYCIDYSINTAHLYSKFLFHCLNLNFTNFNQKNCFLSAESESLVLYQGINESLYLFLWSQIGIIVFDEHELILHVNQGLTLSTASLVSIYISIFSLIVYNETKRNKKCSTVSRWNRHAANFYFYCW